MNRQGAPTDREAEEIERTVLGRYHCPRCKGPIVMEELRFPSKEEDWWEMEVCCQMIECDSGALYLTISRAGKFITGTEWHGRDGCQESRSLKEDMMMTTRQTRLKA
jgi:hypothetical protein